MPVDPQQLMAMMKRTRDAFPAIQERAIQSGDFSELDKASAAMDRLSSLADQHIATQQQAPPQSAPTMPQMPAAGLEATGASPDPASKALDDVIASQHIQKQADTSGGTSPVQEATKGAVKGVLEAAAPKMPVVGFPSAPLAHRRGPPEMPPPAAMPDPETDQVINQAYRIDQGGYDAELENALAQAKAIQKPDPAMPDVDEALAQARRISSDPEDQDTQAYLDLPPAERQQEMRKRLGAVFPPGKDEASKALDDVLSSAPPEEAPSLPGSNEEQAPEDGEARDFGAMPPSPKDVAKVAGKEFGNDPKRLVQGLAPYAKDAPAWEREYLQRVALELGDRPKQGVFEKLAIALTLGAGSIMGAWLSHRYSGQALLDMNGDQQDYDKAKREIGKETYLANKGLDKAALPLPDRKEIEQAKEEGRNSRASGANDTKLAVAGNAEAGKNARQEKDLASKERIANIRSATTGAARDRLSSGDKIKLDELKMQYNKLDPILVQNDPATKKEAERILREIEGIVGQYPQKGK